MNRRGLLSFCVVAALLAWPAPGARGQDPAAAETAWQDNPCLLPEEVSVIELMASRTGDLDQREELVVLREQAILAQQKEIEDEIAHLEALRTEIEGLLEARAAARAEGAGALVQMVNSMRSSDAAEMLSEMDPVLATAVLERLSPRQAGRILGAMNPRIAASLSTSLALDPIEVDVRSKEEP